MPKMMTSDGDDQREERRDRDDEEIERVDVRGEGRRLLGEERDAE